MKELAECYRQHGTIREVTTGDDDGRWITTWVFLDFAGSSQGFGGYVLNEHVDAWNQELCVLFGVSKLADLVGKHCWALRCFSGWNQTIQGLEAQDGKRFLASRFFRGRLPTYLSPLEARRAALRSSILCSLRRAEEETEELAKLEADYVDWEVRR